MPWASWIEVEEAFIIGAYVTVAWAYEPPYKIRDEDRGYWNVPRWRIKRGPAKRLSREAILKMRKLPPRPLPG
jgi:hypothetical protein